MQFNLGVLKDGLRMLEAGEPSLVHLLTTVGESLSKHEGATQEMIEIGEAIVSDVPELVRLVMAPAEPA